MSITPVVLGNGVELSPIGSEDASTFDLGATVTLACSNAGAFATVRWLIKKAPDNSTTTLSAPEGSSSDLGLLDKPGRWSVRCIGYDSRGIPRGAQTVYVFARDINYNLRQFSGDEDIRLQSNDFRAAINQIIAILQSGAGGSDNATKLQGRNLAATAPLADQFVGSPDGATWAPRFITQDMIRPGVSTTLAKVGGNALLEIGSSLATPSFTSSPSSTPSASSVSDTDGHTQDLSVAPATPNAWTSPHSYAKTANGASVTWTKTDVIDGVTKTAAVSQQWGTRVYWGGDSNTSSAIQAMSLAARRALITGLSGTALETARTRSLNFTMSVAGQRALYPHPTSLGAPNFKDTNGLVITPELVLSGVVVPNVNGVDVTFDLYALSGFSTGATTYFTAVS